MAGLRTRWTNKRLVVLALVGLGLALYCVDASIRLGSARPDRLLDLPAVRSDVGTFLDRITAPGPTATLALLCGVVAMLVGIVLIVGVLVPRRQRLVLLERNAEEGTLAARPAPLRDMARALAASAEGTTAVSRPRVRRSGRLRSGRLSVTASRSRNHDSREVQHAVDEQLRPLTEPFKVRSRVHIRSAGQGERVQ